MRAILTTTALSVNVGEFYMHPEYTFVGLPSPLNSPRFELKIISEDLQNLFNSQTDYSNEFDIEIKITAKPKPKEIIIK